MSKHHNYNNAIRQSTQAEEIPHPTDVTSAEAENTAVEITAENERTATDLDTGVSKVISPVYSNTAAEAEKAVVEITAEDEDETADLDVELSKIYKYEGETIERINLSGLEDISVEQQHAVDKLYRKITKNISSTPEFTPDYAVAMASVLTDLPLEFLKHISFKDKIKLKNAVMNFLYGD